MKRVKVKLLYVARPVGWWSRNDANEKILETIIMLVRMPVEPHTSLAMGVKYTTIYRCNDFNETIPWRAHGLMRN